MLRWTAALLGLTLSTPAWPAAGAAGRKLAVVDVSTPPAMLGLGQQITQALSQEAKAQGFQILTPDDILATLGAKPYEDLQACGGNGVCVAHKLDPLGVDKAVVGTLARDEKNYLVHLWLVDIHAKDVVADVDRAILIASRRLMADVKLAVPDLLRGKKEARGTLRLAANVKGATAFVDGELAGKTPLDLLLKPGKHEVRLEKKSYLPITRLVTVAANAVDEENLRLTLAPGEKPEEQELPDLVARGTPSSEESGFRVPLPAWVALGVGAAAAGTATGFGLAASHLDQRLQNGLNAQTQIYAGTRAQALAGKQDAAVANIAWAVASAGLLTAAVLTAVGQGADTVQVSPAAGSHGAAMVLEGRF
jgi:hypothetical protein